MNKNIRFNKTVITALRAAPSGKRDTYQDKGLQGLSLRVTDKGSKSFLVQRRVSGKVVKVTLGRFPTMSVEQARLVAKQVIAKMAEGVNPSIQKREQSLADAQNEIESQSVEQVLSDYVDIHHVRASTQSNYKSTLSTVLGSRYQKPLFEITAADVMLLHSSYHSKARANAAMRALRALFNFQLIRCEMLDRANPVSRALTHPGKANRWHKSKRRRTYIESEQLPAWFDALDALPDAGYRSTWNGQTARDLFLFQLMTGLRSIDECASLGWSQVDLRKGTVTYTHTKTTDEDDEAVVIPLNTHALAILKGRPIGRYVFAQNGHYLKDARSYVRKIRKLAAIQWTPYDSRRTFLTAGEGLAISELTLKRLVNHTTVEHDVTAGYKARDMESMLIASQKIGDHIMAQGKRLNPKVVEFA